MTRKLTPENLNTLIVGHHPAMREARQLIVRLASSPVPVLIEGPTGSGKELVAYALHALSGCPGEFVAVNVGGVTESMFEDSFFGHCRGAFTGATETTRGYIERSEKGTLFLDEVGRFSPATQAKLLRAIDARTYNKIGSPMELRSEFRLISATNKSLDALVASEKFETDLLYRLRGVRISLPPLNQRRDDIEPIARAYLNRVAESIGRSIALNASGLAVLKAHGWPGNVRELQHVLGVAIALSDEPTLDAAHVSAVLEKNQYNSSELLEADTETRLRRQVTEALEREDWDVPRAAAALKKDKSTVYKYIHRFSIARRSDGSDGDGPEHGLRAV